MMNHATNCPACDLCADNVTHVYHLTGSQEEALANIMKLPKNLRFAYLYGAAASSLGQVLRPTPAIDSQFLNSLKDLADKYGLEVGGGGNFMIGEFKADFRRRGARYESSS